MITLKFKYCCRKEMFIMKFWSSTDNFVIKKKWWKYTRDFKIIKKFLGIRNFPFMKMKNFSENTYFWNCRHSGAYYRHCFKLLKTCFIDDSSQCNFMHQFRSPFIAFTSFIAKKQFFLFLGYEYIFLRVRFG